MKRYSPSITSRIVNNAINRSLLILVLVLTALHISFAQTTYTSNAGGTGDWDTSTDWVSNSNPGVDKIQNATINIVSGDSIVRDGDLEFWNNDTLNITGVLTVTGNVTIKNNLIMNVTGTIYFQGSLNVQNNAELTISGTGGVDVTGDATFGNGTTAEVDGTLSVGGDLDFGGGVTSVTGTGTIDAPNSIVCSDIPDFDDCGDVDNPLPIELLFFEAQLSETGVRLSWATSTEINNDFYTIEQSKDGLNFVIREFVQGAGNSTGIINYDFIDRNPTFGFNYYRLKQTDFDGVFSYSDVIVIINSIHKEFEIYPNPVQTEFSIRNDTGSTDDAGSRIIIRSLDGKIIFDKITTDLDNISIPHLENGAYLLEWRTENNTYTKQILIRN